MNILILKTTVSTSFDISLINLIFSEQNKIIDYSFDLTDRDKILRIIYSDIRKDEIIHALMQEGIACQELAD